MNTSAVHDNTLPAKECYQPLDYGGVNRTLDGLSEDCLILDVYRPDVGVKAQRIPFSHGHPCVLWPQSR